MSFWPRGLWDLRSPTRVGTPAPCSGSAESSPPGSQGSHCPPSFALAVPSAWSALLPASPLVSFFTSLESLLRYCLLYELYSNKPVENFKPPPPACSHKSSWPCSTLFHSTYQLLIYYVIRLTYNVCYLFPHPRMHASWSQGFLSVLFTGVSKECRTSPGTS